MGLTLHVYRWNLGDCSNGGISGRADEVVCVNVEGPSEPDENRPAVILIDGNVDGTVRVVPADHVHDDVWIEHGNGVGPMMGGSYVGTSDGRFTDAVEALTGARFYGAVAFHDRYETAEQYASFD